MFTAHDRFKELVEFLIISPEVETSVTNEPGYPAKGVAVVKSFNYNISDMQVQYKKWIVESFSEASKMNLPGCGFHNKLVQGSGVHVLSKKLGSDIFYGQDAQEIIQACESCRIKKIQMLTNNITR